MGYLYLFFALAFGLIKIYCGKRSSAAATCSYNAIIINTVRMILCVIIGLLFVLIGKSLSLSVITAPFILIALICGISTAAFMVCWLLAVHSNAYMIVEVFVMGGTILPLILSAALYGERIGFIQIIGVTFLLIAVYCISTDKKKEKITLSLKNLVLLLLCALSSGMVDFSQKIFVKEIVNVNISVFNLFTYLFAAITLLIVCPIFREREKSTEKLTSWRSFIKPIFHFILIMAACLFLNSYFKTKSAIYLDAILLYPLNQGCAVVLSLLMSIFVFKERITTKGIMGIVLSIISMILINVFAQI